MEKLMNELTASGFRAESFLMAGLFFIAASLLIGWLGRMIFGAKNDLSHAVSSAIGILFIYIITVVIMMAGPELNMFRGFLAPLPYIEIQNETLQLFVFEGAPFAEICTQILSMVILAFLVNLFDTILPRGEGIISWFLLRCITVVLAMLSHWVVCYIFTTFLPDVIVTYSPVILLGVLVVMLSVGMFKYIVGAALATVNPIIGALYTFFFANLIGKQISKSVLTTALLSLLIWGLHQLGVTTISIALGALVAYLPLLIVLLAVWYIANRLL
jgi:hypothetical protein